MRWHLLVLKLERLSGAFISHYVNEIRTVVREVIVVDCSDDTHYGYRRPQSPTLLERCKRLRGGIVREDCYENRDENSIE
jgi:hypothetical protein